MTEGWQLWDSAKGACVEADACVLPLMVAPAETEEQVLSPPVCS